ncbi:MAG: helix-turn-helix transcriptional regulator [Myxococcota bacterium]
MLDGPLVPLGLSVPVLGLADEHGPDRPIPSHRHDAAQLIHAASGVMKVRTEHGLWIVPPSRAVWVPAQTTHSIDMIGVVALRTIYLDPDFAALDPTRCRVVQVSALLRAAILRVVDFGPDYPEEGPEANLARVIRDELRTAEVSPLHLPTLVDLRARRVAEAFERHPADRRTRRAWARLAGASERTLERLFHREARMSFGRWQRQVRLVRALEGLAEGRSVTEVALDVGFETPSAFIAMFRSAMGTTPGRYFDDPTRDARA